MLHVVDKYSILGLISVMVLLTFLKEKITVYMTLVSYGA